MTGDDSGKASDVDRWIEGLDHGALTSLVHELAALSPEGARLLAVRVAQDGGGVTDLARQFKDEARDALRTARFVDYRAAVGVTRDAQDLLAELESHLTLGTEVAAETVRPALQYATERLRKIALHADTSDGGIGWAGQTAAELHAQSCRQGRPDPVKLAKWLVAFRRDSPGWPDVTLDMYVEAFNDKALAAYRRGAEEYWASFEEPHGSRSFEATRMVLELADHDGDVDRAIELLSAGERPTVGGIVQRLRDAGRHDDAMTWVDRAVELGRLTPREGNEYWLGVSDVVDAYLDVGRQDDALDLLHGEFDRRVDDTAYARLIAYAVRLGRADEERSWGWTRAVDWAERNGRGELPIVVALADDDPERAWVAADRWGAGTMWRRLADEGAAVRPRAAADLHRPWLGEQLGTPDVKRYPGIAQALVRMRQLYAVAGAGPEFDAEIRELREEYKRRPSLIKELDRAGLPR